MDIKAGIYDANGSGITGSSNLRLKVKRDSDDYFLDFTSLTFKASGHSTTYGTMTQVSATLVPGEYEYNLDISGWDDGWYTAYVQYVGTNPFTDIQEFYVFDGEVSSSKILNLVEAWQHYPNC